MTEGEPAESGEGPEDRANRRICSLFDACRDDGSARARRDAALISVLYGADVPRERALRLGRSAYDEETGRLDAAPAPGKARWAVDGARRALDDWIELRGEEPGPLFCRVRGGRPEPRRPLSVRTVDRILARWARAAGLDGLRTAPFRELYDSPWWRGSCPG